MYSNHIFIRLIPSPRQRLSYNSLNSLGSLQSTRFRSVFYGEPGPLIFVSRMQKVKISIDMLVFTYAAFAGLYYSQSYACSALCGSMRLDQYRITPSGTAPGNVVVVVPPNSASAESEERKFPRKNEAKGAIQIIIGMLHVALGGILLFSAKEFVPLTMSAWYPFWGAALFFLSGYLASAAAVKPVEGLAAASHILNSFSVLGALAGICLLTIDLIKIFILDHQQTSPQFLAVVGFLSKYIIPLPCEGNLNNADYCRVIKAYQTGILSVMLIFSTVQAVAAFSTLRSNKKKKSRKDNEEQNVALLPVMPPHQPDEYSPPPQYCTASNDYRF